MIDLEQDELALGWGRRQYGSDAARLSFDRFYPRRLESNVIIALLDYMRREEETVK